MNKKEELLMKMIKHDNYSYLIYKKIYPNLEFLLKSNFNKMTDLFEFCNEYYNEIKYIRNSGNSFYMYKYGGIYQLYCVDFFASAFFNEKDFIEYFKSEYSESNYLFLEYLENLI